MFQTAAPLYQEALKRSGYNYQLKFNPVPENGCNPPRNRKRKIVFFNPPYSANVKTNIGEKFLKLIDKHFPPSNPLSKIVNRNSVKLSYRTTPNMAKIISANNSKILKQLENKPEKRTCSCPKNATCPLDGKCLTDNLIYQATVTHDGRVNTYIGLTSSDFKTRLANHNKSFNHEKYKHETSLSTHIWALKQENFEYDLKWKIMARAKPFCPVTGVCQLCTRENFYIIYKPELATLNTRSEINTHCRHKQAVLLDNT